MKDKAVKSSTDSLGPVLGSLGLSSGLGETDPVPKEQNMKPFPLTSMCTGLAPSFGCTYRDGEIVLHVSPDDAVPDAVHPSPTFARRVPVQKPPCCIHDADQPKASEEEADEESYAALR